MRIAVVEPSGTGGLVHFAYQLCDAMAAHGADVTLLTNSHYELSAWPHNHRVLQTMKLWPIVEHGSEGRPASVVRRIWKGIRRALRGLILLREWLRLTVFLARTRPDIVQLSGIAVPAPWLFFTALRRRGITIAQICHEYEERDEGARFDRLRGFLLAKTYERMNAVFFLSKSVRDALSGRSTLRSSEPMSFRMEIRRSSRASSRCPTRPRDTGSSPATSSFSCSAY